MAKKTGTIIIAVGLICLISAFGFYLHNQNESKTAGESAGKVLEELDEAVEEYKNESKAISEENSEENSAEMPTVTIDGYDYIGYIEIPKISIRLPVMSEWDYDRLKIAPCRNFGSVFSDDLVIAGHNYTAHFGKLDNLTSGDSVVFADALGLVYSYTVQKLDTVAPKNVDAVQNSGYDLVLYTCTLSGTERTAVYCNRANY